MIAILLIFRIGAGYLALRRAVSKLNTPCGRGYSIRRATVNTEALQTMSLNSGMKH